MWMTGLYIGLAGGIAGICIAFGVAFFVIKLKSKKEENAKEAI